MSILSAIGNTLSCRSSQLSDRPKVRNSGEARGVQPRWLGKGTARSLHDQAGRGNGGAHGG